MCTASKLNGMDKRQVVFDHDGGVDDFLSLLLLLTMNHIDLRSITIAPADCFLENAFATTYKLLSLANRTNIPIGIGNYYGINAFPAQWRASPKVLNALPPIINIDAPDSYTHCPSSLELLYQSISSGEKPVTVLMTGPCSNLVHVLEKHPEIKPNIQEVVWMGGAIDVPGNVKMYNSNGTAEWNVFWDPESAHRLVRMGLPLTFIPLDATNAVPVNFDFLKRLAKQSNSLYANIAAQFWATTVATIPSYETIYFMWDVLTTSYLAIPHIFSFENIELEISPSGADAGRTYRKPGSGLWVKVAKQANKEAFYDYIIGQFG